MPLRSFGAFYSRSFAARPWLTLAITNGGLSMTADGLAQLFEHANASSSSSALTKESSSSFDYDPSRGARFLAFGAGMAPLLAEWNKFIELKFPLRSVGTALPVSAAALSGGGKAALAATAAAAAKSATKVSALALVKRVVVDQGAFAPIGLALFVGFMGFTEGRDVQGVQNKFTEVYWPAMLANWQVWPAVQAINFRYMPLKYRVPFVSSCGVGWTVFLSMLQSRKRSEARDQVEIAT